ncbi:hypothetical protein [Chryseolinea sp. H1M3-3]|uniref:hypothetical protein n=1 Tax=Chryseolinea sp. H1M3-3 TaxID=3034144 RepID=UPI0023EDEA59|nr:hypothetical protein [Chryseolinea sp. H1M3-3]
MNKTSQESPGFTLFAFTWAVAGLFHQLSFESWRWYDIKGIVLTGVILLVLLKPSSWKRFAFYLIVDWIVVAWTFPYHPNHIVFSWIVNSTLLTALFIAVLRDRSELNLGSRWYSIFAPWLRIELCLLYFFTVFHKLNTSYFNLDWSCAAQMHREINEWMPLLPGARWAQSWAIYGTLIIETAIPLLLLKGRTRLAGVILGMLFHGLLALHHHPGLYSFSSTMTALFMVFLPLNASETLLPPRRFRQVLQWGLIVFGVGVFLWIIRRWLPFELRVEDTLEYKVKSGFVAYFAYLGLGLYWIWRNFKSLRIQSKVSSEGRWRASPLLIIFPLLLIVNGFGPYIGLRTQTSFSMFSNLHTENGVSNHLIVPDGIQITDWQYDLVEIVDASDPDLTAARDSNLMVVYLDLRRRRSGGSSDFWVKFHRKGRTEIFDSARPETHSSIPSIGLLARRYFYFRPVEKDPLNVRCKH